MNVTVIAEDFRGKSGQGLYQRSAKTTSVTGLGKPSTIKG